MKLSRSLFTRSVAAVAALTMIVAACGDDKADSTASAATEGVKIEGVWARKSPAMATAGAAYMQITAAEDDALISASTSSDIAGMVQIHEVVPVESTETTMGDMSMSEDSMAGSMDSGSMEMGEMTMREVESIALPAGETVSLQPGGYHVMLLDLPAPLELGQTFTLELTFEKAGTVPVEVTVAEDAP
ncbi:MAG: copper chaperone PCu(A)C [Ilumatobacteraceae bacterium]